MDKPEARRMAGCAAGSEGNQVTCEDIIRMAREAASEDDSIDRNDGKNVVLYAAKTSRFLERFAALVAAAEREECAKLAESTICDTHLPTGVRIYGTRVADAIRARGNK